MILPEPVRTSPNASSFRGSNRLTRTAAGQNHRCTGSDAARNEQKACIQNRVPQKPLHEERQDRNRAEHRHTETHNGDVGPGETAIPEDRKVDDVVAFAIAPDDKCGPAHEKRQRRDLNHLGRKPVPGFAQIQHQLQRTDSADHQRKADPVDLDAFGVLAFQFAGEHDQRECGNRQVYVKDCTPGKVLGQQRADGGAKNRCDNDSQAEQRHRLTAFLL